MASPTVGAIGTYYAPGGSGGTSHAIPVPAGVVAGSYVEAYFYIESSQTVTPPSGEWAEIPNAPFTTGTVTGQRIFWKRSTTTDSGTYTFTTATNAFRECVAIRYDNVVATGTPYDTGAGAPNGAQRSSAGTTTPAVSLTTQGVDRLIVWSGGTVGTGTAWTPPTGYAEQVDTSKELTVATLAQATAAATGSVTGTGSSGFETGFIHALLPVAPATRGQFFPFMQYHEQEHVGEYENVRGLYHKNKRLWTPPRRIFDLAA